MLEYPVLLIEGPVHHQSILVAFNSFQVRGIIHSLFMLFMRISYLKYTLFVASPDPEQFLILRRECSSHK